MKQVIQNSWLEHGTFSIINQTQIMMYEKRNYLEYRNFKI